MSGIPLNVVSQFLQFADTLEQCGSSPERLIRRLGMPMWHHCAPDALMPADHVFKFAHSAARMAGDGTFGVRVMERNPLETVARLGGMTSDAQTVLQALRAIIRLFPSHVNSRRVWLSQGREDVWFCHGGGILFDVGERESIQYALTAMVQTVRMGAGRGWRPTKVVLRATDTLGLESVEMFSGARIQLHKEMSAVAIPRSLLCLPIGPSARSGPDSGRVSADETLQQAPADNFVGSLRQVIATLLPEGYPHIQFAAEITGFSVRTLQRRLVHEGVPYKRLVEQVRFEAATSSLKNTDASVTDIAFDLGYTDVAHFSFAFCRWAGVSPREYRRLSLAS